MFFRVLYLAIQRVFPYFELYQPTPKHMLTIDSEIAETEAKIKQLEAGYSMLRRLRTHLTALKKLRDGKDPGDEDKEDSPAVDASAGLSEDQ